MKYNLRHFKTHRPYHIAANVYTCCQISTILILQRDLLVFNKVENWYNK